MAHRRFRAATGRWKVDRFVYPHVLRYARSRRVRLPRPDPGDDFDELTRGSTRRARSGGDFCLATHYWEVDATLHAGAGAVAGLRGQFPDVRFVAAEELFAMTSSGGGDARAAGLLQRQRYAEQLSCCGRRRFATAHWRGVSAHGWAPVRQLRAEIDALDLGCGHRPFFMRCATSGVWWPGRSRPMLERRAYSRLARPGVHRRQRERLSKGIF